MRSPLQTTIYTMMNKYKKHLPELLAPAGSFDALKAAVQNGADAVYLGLKTGSARMGAENFTLTQLEKAVSYAHIRGVRIYLALNTLVYNSEIEQTFDIAKQAVKTGIDAIILQDLGLAKRISENRSDFPCELHASTQMSIYNKEGLKFLKELGFNRCITARELYLKEIASLCNQSDSLDSIEIEVFCHGALCMSMSGQCLLSSFIGGRSGNRGTCAQPCRKKYSICTGKYESSPAYRLSPSDFASLPYIKELIETGVHSLKIEGRLKSPAYVAAVTRSYRRAIDICSQSSEQQPTVCDISEDMKTMQLLFGRGDFTSGYLKGKLPFKDITFNSAGRVGLPAGKLKSLPEKLPSPKNLPQNLTRFKFTAYIDKDITINVGDGITIYDLGGKEQKAIAGGTVNAIIKTGKNLPDNKNGDLYEITAVGNYTDRGTGPFILTLTDNARLREELNSSINAENRKSPISLKVTIKNAELPELEITDEYENKITARGQQKIQHALNLPTTKDEILKHISKLGDTPFKLKNAEIIADDNIFVPVSVLNSLRRDGINKITQKREPARQKEIKPAPAEKEYKPAPLLPGISLFFYTAEKFAAYNDSMLPEELRPYKNENRTYYIPMDMFYPEKQNAEIFQAIIEKISHLHAKECKIIAYFPYISLGAALEKVRKNFEYVCLNHLYKNIDGFLCQNPGDLMIVKQYAEQHPGDEFSICCDYSFNIANSEAFNLFSFTKNINVSRITLSVEGAEEFARTADISKSNVNPEIIVDGKIVLMRSRHCYIDEGECGGKCSKCEKDKYFLKDTFGCKFPILPQKDDCCSILLSPAPIKTDEKDIKKIRSICNDITLRVNI